MSYIIVYRTQREQNLLNIENVNIEDDFTKRFDFKIVL